MRMNLYVGCGAIGTIGVISLFVWFCLLGPLPVSPVTSSSSHWRIAQKMTDETTLTIAARANTILFPEFWWLTWRKRNVDRAQPVGITFTISPIVFVRLLHLFRRTICFLSELFKLCTIFQDTCCTISLLKNNTRTLIAIFRTEFNNNYIK